MRTPRRWGGHAALAALILAACGDSDESLSPLIRAPAVGTYAYEATVQTEDTASQETFSGSLVIEVSSEDSIVGTWDVPGYASAARGIWNITAYTLPADPNPPVHGDVTHRVWRVNADGVLNCNLSYQRVRTPADTFRTSTDNECTLVRIGD